MASNPYVSILFGSHRAAAQIMKASQAGTGCCTYTISVDVPQFIATGWTSSSNVPLGLVIESNGEELARVDNAGLFTYHDAHSGSTDGAGAGVGSSGDTSAHDGPMRRTSPSQGQSPEQRSSPSQQNPSVRTTATSSPLSSQQTSPVDQATNTYGYPPSETAVAAAAHAQAHAHAQAQAQAQADSNFAAATGALSQDSGSMLGAYRTSGYGHYSRAPPALRSRRSSGWASYYDAVNGPSSGNVIGHTVTRPSLTPSQHHHSPSGPQLIRTSTMPGSTAVGGGGYSNPYSIFPAKATLEIKGDLSTMADNWTPEEWDNRRRIVLFRRSQDGSQLQCSFRPVSVNERPPNSTLISCIWWAEKNECFVTSVDTIHLLEQLVATPPSRFTVEEKNRIRRNLEGLHPITVSKSKAESEEFFKLIMAFGAPKPRNIEKDVKVFPWRILDQALKKIISKYCAPSSSQYHPMPGPMLTPLSGGGPYSALPPAPGPATTSAGHATASGYISSGHHHGEPMPSPRSLSGIPPPWPSYPTAPSRTLSPGVRINSPATSSGLRVSTLPAIYDPRTTIQSMPSLYNMASTSNTHHHAPQHSQASYSQSLIPVVANQTRAWDGRWDTTPSQRSMDGRNWDGYGVPEGYREPEAYRALDSYQVPTSHSVHGSQPPVYGPGAYGESAQRCTKPRQDPY